MPVVVRPVDSEGEALFRLEDEIRKMREEEDEKLMEKYAQIETNYQAKRLPKLRREEARWQEEEAERRAEEQRAREEQERRRMEEEEKRKGEKEKLKHEREATRRVD